MKGAAVVHYDPLDPDTLENPYSFYRQLRKNSPVFWHEQMKSWVLAGYHDCREVLRDHEVFARDRGRLGIEVPEFQQNIQSLDPRTRRPCEVFTNALRRQDLDSVASAARRQILALLESLADRPRFDFMLEIAAPVALTMTSQLLGVPEPDLAEYVDISDWLAQRMDAGLRPEAVESGDLARKKLIKLVDQWFDGAGVDGGLAGLQQDAKRDEIPEHYVRNTVGTVFNASFGTLYATAGNVLLTLFQHPEAFELLKDSSLLASGTDELIRFDGPAQATSRVAVSRTKIGGITIERGQTVVALLASANRDPEQFDRPDELVLDRKPNRHLGFGWGPHACLGSMFGQIAVRALVESLVELPAPLRMAGSPTRRRTATVRTIGVFPVSLDGRTGR
ncbi:cytochrome P450 [Streptacidiphilus sp. 4-A2]|nr:cytochrome P450 [Streptacidiphilus sp. 4-A2]